MVSVKAAATGRVSWGPMVRGLGPLEHPVVDMLRSFPKVGVDAALCKVMEEMEEELSARARGAKGGGLPETGGLKGRDRSVIGFPGGSFGREDGRGGGGGGTGLPRD